MIMGLCTTENYADEIWRTGLVHMELNVMPGLVSYESDRKESYEYVNSMLFLLQECWPCKERL